MNFFNLILLMLIGLFPSKGISLMHQWEQEVVSTIADCFSESEDFEFQRIEASLHQSGASLDAGLLPWASEIEVEEEETSDWEQQHWNKDFYESSLCNGAFSFTRTYYSLLTGNEPLTSPVPRYILYQVFII